MTVLEQNYRCKMGEIDLICRKQIGPVKWLVFVEVKYRASDQYGRPEEAVTFAKQQTIRKVAQYYLMMNHLPVATPCRFDVIAILAGELSHLEGVF